MTDRIEIAAMAAAKAEDASNWHDEHEYYRSGWCNRMAPGIEAVEAMMFSDEAIERAAANAWNTLTARDGGRNWEDLEERMRPYWIANVRVIAAALKGEQ